MFDGMKGGLIMQFIKLMRVATGLVFAAAFTSCNIGSTPEPVQDVNAIYTSVAGTMVAQFNDQQTQTAQAVPPLPAASPTALDTFTPLPTNPVTPSETPFSINTPSGLILPATSIVGGTPGSTLVGCDNATYVSETVPNTGEQFRPGVNFSKSWTLQNTGTCPWINSFVFGFVSGDRMGGKEIPITRKIDFVAAGNMHTFTVYFQAPHAKGHYRGVWQMKNASNIEFGTQETVDIIVK
jgi:hypothetical protein